MGKLGTKKQIELCSKSVKTMGHIEIVIILYLPEPLFFSARDRFEQEHPDGGNIRLIIDSTSCPIVRPVDPGLQRAFWTYKKGWAIKYEVAIHLFTGKILWVSRAYPGSVSDIQVSRTSGFLFILDPGEMVLADKGYYGENVFVVPFKGNSLSEDQRDFNLRLSKLRVKVENTFSFVKDFDSLVRKWRHDRALHPLTFRVICKLVNFDHF